MEMQEISLQAGASCQGELWLGPGFILFVHAVLRLLVCAPLTLVIPVRPHTAIVSCIAAKHLHRTAMEAALAVAG